MDFARIFSNDRFKGWMILASLQILVSLALFHDFLFGDRYFAFLDIGSDTYHQYVPTLIHMASPGNWGSAWSFNVGLGGLAPFAPDPFMLLGIAGGAEHVLDLRIWVYMAKILAGGAAFYGFGLAIGARREIALMVALAYSFCGYIMTDGQWDPFSADFAAYAVILWALARHAHRRSSWLIPLSIVWAAYTGPFNFFSIGVFILYIFLAALVASDRPAATAATWLRSIFPKCMIGLLLSAPVVLPVVFRLLESPRVTGPQSTFATRLSELLSLNDGSTILVELAGFFHKNLLGVGNQHAGWMNYLESPGFYVSLLALSVIPQLWRGNPVDRRILIAGGAALGLFVLLPAVRYLAFGFGLDYFRVNNLWVSILLLVLASRALGVIAERGVGPRLLAATFAVLAVLLLYLHDGLLHRISFAHERAIFAFSGLTLLLLGLFAGKVLQWKNFSRLALGLVAVEVAVINYPSFHDHRHVVTPRTVGFKDATLPALAFLKNRDQGFYRVEKTYNSVSLCDALAQDYMGVKSYWFQSTGVTGFYTDLDLLPRRSRIKNFTNWLPNFDGRYALYTLTGVKYVIANQALDWRGFRKIREEGALSILENDLALPLGVVYERQFPREQFVKMTREARDITMINAVIVDRLRGDSPAVFDVTQFARASTDWLEDNYVIPARTLKRRGLVIDRFSDGNIAGRIDSEVPGVLVFSIPHARGWSVEIDGVEKPLFSANLGFLAVDLPKGPHRVELRYALPGLVPGLLIGFLGLLLLVVSNARPGRFRVPALSRDRA